MKLKYASVNRLRQTSDIWFLCVREIPLNLMSTTLRPAVMLIMNLTDEQVLAIEPFESPPDATSIQEYLLRTMSQSDPELKLPYRPSQVFFDQDDLLKELAPALQEIQVATGLAETPPLVDAFIADIAQALLQPPKELPGLLSIPGVDPKMVASLFDAAAYFYRAAPWKRIANTQTIAVQIDPPGQELFVQVMGNGGMEFGLTLYTSWEDVLHVFEHADSPLELVPESGMHGLSFEAMQNLPAEDQRAIRKHGWKTASHKACPMPVIFTKSGEAERPSRQYLLYYEVLMRGLPEFINNHLIEDGMDFKPAEALIETRHYDGQVRLTMRYPAGELPLEEQGVFWLEDEGESLELPPSLQEANRLADQAWKENDPEQRLSLAHKALKTSPDCAEAYLVLAYEAETPEESLASLEKAVQAGERALGQEFIQRNAGALWDWRDARPYLRARDGLAETLEDLGRLEEALAHYNELLKLNQEDHQGVRYRALRLLLQLKRDPEAQELIDEYAEDISATWVYSRALLAFRKHGDLSQSRKWLKQAIRVNPHVPPYLTGAKPLPAEAPEVIGFGDENEAIDYALEHYPLWWSTPGAVDWLKRHR